MFTACLLAYAAAATTPATELIEIRYVEKEVQTISNPFWLENYRPKVVTMTVVEEASPGVGYRKVSRYEDIVETISIDTDTFSAVGIKDGIKIRDFNTSIELFGSLLGFVPENIGSAVYGGGLPSVLSANSFGLRIDTVVRKTERERLIGDVSCWLEITDEKWTAPDEDAEFLFRESWRWWPEDEQLRKDIGPMEFYMYEITDGNAELLAYERIVEYKVATRTVGSDWPMSASLPVSKLGNINKSMAVAIALQALTRNAKSVDSARIEVNRHGSGWSVAIWDVPARPGGLLVIEIDSKGKITNYRRGR